MAPTIRTIAPAEFAAWIAVTDQAFHQEPPAEQVADFRRSQTDFQRAWGAFDDGRIVGTTRSFATELTLPGGTIPADAVSAVAVLPTHRRRGILTQMIGTDLRAAAERGDPVSILIASEYPIYGRFGYGVATEHATYAVDTARARFSRPSASTMELMAPAAARDIAQSLYNQFRVTQPGAIHRSDGWWNIALRLVDAPPSYAPGGLIALCRDPAGDPSGYVRYRVEPVWAERRSDSTLVVSDLVATTAQAYGRLWQFCCEVDLVRTVRAEDRSVQEPLSLYLKDGRAVRQVSRADFLWVRVLDAAGVLSRRRYLSEGRVVVEVVDALGFAGGRFLLHGGPDGAQCTTTSQAADVTLPVATLGAISLGGASLRQLADAGLAEEHTPGALDRADALFRSTVAPWCHTWF